MRQLNPVKLHELIASATLWTDELWNAALAYVLENTATPDAIVMARMVLGSELSQHMYKIDYLREFRGWPPTVLPGAFDLMRHQKWVRADARRTGRHW